MPLLIDGYNLLFTAGYVNRRYTKSELTRGQMDAARSTLVQFLVKTLKPHELVGSTIVFDAKHAPAGLEDELHVQGLRVIFAKGYEEADELIEEWISQETQPSPLHLITSDVRLQTAANRRRIAFTDSDTWMVELEGRSDRPTKASDGRSGEDPHDRRASSTGDLSAEEVRDWLREFEIGDTDEDSK